MNLWANLDVKKRIKILFSTPEQYHERKNKFDRNYSGQSDTWACAWNFNCLSQAGLAVVPAVNLVSNIGFDKQATHTVSLNSPIANIPRQPMIFPLSEPNGLTQDKEYDHEYYLQCLGGKKNKKAARLRKLKDLGIKKGLMFLKKTLQSIESMVYYNLIPSFNLPRQINYAATQRCNSQCKMCNVWKYGKKEISASQLAKIFNHPYLRRVTHIGISGGEVTELDDLAQRVNQICISLKKLENLSVILNCVDYERSKKCILDLQKITKVKGISF